MKITQSLGLCRWCHQPIPAHNIDGTPSREGIEYKRVFGEPTTMWHLHSLLYPDCFHAESRDPRSIWYDDRREFEHEETDDSEVRAYYGPIPSNYNER